MSRFFRRWFARKAADESSPTPIVPDLKIAPLTAALPSWTAVIGWIGLALYCVLVEHSMDKALAALIAAFTTGGLKSVIRPVKPAETDEPDPPRPPAVRAA